MDRSLIRHCELERDGTQPDFRGRSLAACKAARPDHRSQAACREILCNLKTIP
jgi:hypothetical protein